MKVLSAARHKYRSRRRGISRNDLLDALLPGLYALFNLGNSKEKADG